jgi:hypothetical protein
MPLQFLPAMPYSLYVLEPVVVSFWRFSLEHLSLMKKNAVADKKWGPGKLI